MIARLSLQLKNIIYTTLNDKVDDIEEFRQAVEDLYKETLKGILGYRKVKSPFGLAKESWEKVEEKRQLRSNI